MTSHRLHQRRLFFSLRGMKRTQINIAVGGAGLVVLSFVLRLHQLARTSFSIDESSSLFFSTFPEWRALFWDNHPPLYHLILKGWLAIFPLSEMGARSLSVAFSVIGVIALVAAGYFSGQIKRGFAAGLLLAASCLSIRYAQEARMYAMVEAMAAVQLAAVLYILSRRKSKAGGAVLIGGAFVSAATHLLGLISTFVLMPILIQKRTLRQKRLISFVVISFIALSAAFAFFRFDSRYVEWQRLSYALSGQVLINLGDFVLAFGQKDLWVSLIFFALALFSLRHPDALQRKLARTLVFGIAIILFAASVAEWSALRRVLVPRYFIFFNPYLIWLAVLGAEVVMSKITRAALAKALGFALLVSFCVFVSNAYKYVKPKWREMAAFAQQQSVGLVMSTRPRGFGVPYYSNALIPYQQFVYSPDFIDVLKFEIEVYGRVMIMDDNINKLNYFVPLLLELNAKRIPHETYDFVDQEAGSVFGIIVHK